MCHDTQTQLQKSNNIKKKLCQNKHDLIFCNRLFHGPVRQNPIYCAIFTFIKDFYGCKTILFQMVEFMNKTKIIFFCSICPWLWMNCWHSTEHFPPTLELFYLIGHLNSKVFFVLLQKFIFFYFPRFLH